MDIDESSLAPAGLSCHFTSGLLPAADEFVARQAVVGVEAPGLTLTWRGSNASALVITAYRLRVLVGQRHGGLLPAHSLAQRAGTA